MGKRQLTHIDNTNTAADSVQENNDNPADPTILLNEGDFDRGVISTGSTLLDLAISAKRVYGGGIPAGIILEIFGPSSSGKTAILAEIAASAKYHGGVVRYDDPEGRLDTVYARQCGLDLADDEYDRPGTVDELEANILGWQPKPLVTGAINVTCEDSLAAFTTEAEIAGHKMAAAKRAQMYHQMFRKAGRLIANEGWIIACSNQEQINFESGARTTPGGNAIKYWASVRIRIAKAYQSGDITRTWQRPSDEKDDKGKPIGKVEIKKTVGIKAIVKVVKNSVSDPFNEVPVYIMFNVGIDDIRGNLQWLKDTTKASKYDCITRQMSQMQPAIKFIEQFNHEAALRDKVIALWAEIDNHFKVERKLKVRF
jgi:RecA/RadA recombinase